MRPAVVVRETAPGRGTVTLDGQKVPGVVAVTVAKRVSNIDVVTIEVHARSVTVLPHDVPDDVLDDAAKVDEFFTEGPS